MEEFEDVIHEDNEIVNENNELEDTEEVIIEDVEVYRTAKGIPEPPDIHYLFSLSRWLSKLYLLKKVLEQALEKSNCVERTAILDDLSEVKKEISYVRWKLVSELNNYRSSCDKLCNECPLELLCKSFAYHVPKPKGARDPWRILMLLRRYGID